MSDKTNAMLCVKNKQNVGQEVGIGRHSVAGFFCCCLFPFSIVLYLFIFFALIIYFLPLRYKFGLCKP